MVIVQHPQEPNDEEPRAFGTRVTFGGRRDRGTGYMAYSQRVGPGVVLLHGSFGLTPVFERMVDRLQEEGFTVLAPDLFDGATATSASAAQALSEDLDRERTMLRLHAAATHLTENWHPRLGVVGFSLGASLACRLSSRVPAEATVLYCGHSDVSPSALRGPVLAHVAPGDEIDPQGTRAFVSALAASGLDAESFLYEGAGPGFTEPGRDPYEGPAAKLAWTRTVEFLHHHLA